MNWINIIGFIYDKNLSNQIWSKKKKQIKLSFLK